MKNQQKALTKIEKKNLENVLENNAIATLYFRSSLFLPVAKTEKTEKKRLIYEDKNTKMFADKELSQKHKDLFIVLMFEEKTDINYDGSFYLKTTLRGLAKKLGYKNPTSAVANIKQMLHDMHKTTVTIKNQSGEINHHLLGDYFKSDDEDSTFMVNIPAITAKYLATNISVVYSQTFIEKVVPLPASHSKVKATISYLLANRSVKISFNKMCEKFGITDRRRKSEYKNSVKKNIELFNECNIVFENDTFYVEKNLFFMYPKKDVENVKQDENEEDEITNEITDEVIEACNFLAKSAKNKIAYLHTLVKNYKNNEDATVVTVNNMVQKMENELLKLKEYYIHKKIEADNTVYTIQNIIRRDNEMFFYISDGKQVYTVPKKEVDMFIK